jgi:Tfp pilus assembly protein PilO
MSQSTKSAVTFLMVLVILAVGYFGVYSQWSKLGDARAAFDQSKQQNELLKKTESEFRAFLTTYEANKSKAEVAERALPTGDANIPVMLDNFTRMVAESGMVLSSISFASTGVEQTTAPTPQSIQTFDVDINITGSYEAFKDFLLRTQRNMRLVDILTMNIGTVEGENRLNFTMKLRTYYQP